LREVISGVAAKSGQIRPNSTRDVFLSLFRSRDDSLVWVASALLNKIVQSASVETLKDLGLTDTEASNSSLFMLLGFIHNLLASESEFRVATVRGLGNLLLNLAKTSKLTYSKISPSFKKDMENQVSLKMKQLTEMANSKQTGPILMKKAPEMIQDYE
jgi:hypothetical protein